jgi:hypothetical protein
MDGETFVLNDGVNPPVTLELDDDGNTVPGNRVITFTNSTTAAQLSAAIAIEIRNAGIGLSPTSSADGVVTLGGTAAYSLDTTNTTLLEIGQPGVAKSEPVPFVPGDTYTVGVPVREPIFDEKEMAVSVRNAINAAVVAGRLIDVVASVRLENGEVAVGEVLVEGVSDITGTSAIFRANIADIAGNALKPNRNDGTTQFTIFIGSGVDYGDAPDRYPTTEVNNGARHEIVGDFFLGDGIDVDFDGQPNETSTGDDDDGFDDEDGVEVISTLTGGYEGTIRVTASADGLLDAWIDYNQDGDWDDDGEQIFASEPLVAGANDLTFDVDGAAGDGDTYSRFRFSSGGGLTPTGFAADGEVEDHLISIQGNPWRNPANALDVNADGFITPIDALLVINDLNRNGPRDLPNEPNPPVPPYLDVNGDTFVSPLGDVLPLINYLNTDGSGEAEGEGGAMAVVETGEGEASDPHSDLGYSALIMADDGSGFQSSSALVDHRVSSADDVVEGPNGAAFLAIADATEEVERQASLAGESEADDLDLLMDELSSGVESRAPTAHELIFQDDDII